jgi:murein DD-endopeptidase MepM/ murein hydrolase activator NlpD
LKHVRGRIALSALALLCLAGPAGGTNPYAKKQAVDAKLSHVQEKIAQLQAREDSLRTEIAGYTAEIRGLERQIGTVQARLEPLQRDLDLHERRLASLNELFRLQTERLQFLRTQYRVALAHLNRRLVGLYENGQPGTLEIVLSSSSLTEILDQLDFLKLLAQQDKRIAKVVEEARNEARVARVKTNETRKRVAAITRVIAARAAQVREVRDRLAASQSQIAGARGKKATTLDNLTADERAERGELEALLRESATLAAKIRAAESSGIVSSTGAGVAPSAAGLIWPVSAPVTSPFGMRWGRMHEGIDLGASYGTPIHAAAAGVVVYASWLGGYGNLAVIDHGGGLSTAYGHQSQIAVSYGQHVAQGEVIGYVGSTGHSTGPHLHFEVRINGSAVDPLGYL